MIYLEIVVIWAAALFVVLLFNYSAHQKETPEITEVEAFRGKTMIEKEATWRTR